MNMLDPTSIILFLDFDGVTHPDCGPVDKLFTLMPLIEEVLVDHNNVSIVISSSWRENYSLDEMQNFFTMKMQSRVIGVAPILGRFQGRWLPGMEPQYEREWECNQWLLENENLIEVDEYQVGEPPQLKWIAIDDMPEWFSPNCPNLLVTNPLIGFSVENQGKLNRMLNARQNLIACNHSNSF